QGDFSYLPQMDVEKADVLYFAGCMTRTMPSILRSMMKILDQSGDKYTFMDRDGTICCGRPMLLSGQTDSARAMMLKNTEIIRRSGAKTLVTSCPICYKVFNEQYSLEGVTVLHHSQYIDSLLQKGKIKVAPTSLHAVYHDPCDLGRGSKVYKEPRRVVSAIATLDSIPQDIDAKKALCCGGSLANTVLSEKNRRAVTLDAYSRLTVSQPDVLATACPLCKKTFAGVSAGGAQVMDIAQMVADNIIVQENKPIDKLNSVLEKAE
ncbi:MAG: (Fe-S)-binding protein, partial [Flavobacteriales bacterium]|nr:(Fe-S)-binding protein [Flavobacteriales bacterium]